MSLKDFCLEMQGQGLASKTVDPEIVAHEFVRFYSLPKIITLARIKQLAKSLGIEKVYPEELPAGYRGYHFGSNGRYELQYRQGDWVGSAEHTAFHEIYEIIEETFEQVSNEFERRTGKSCEIAANAFAAAVLMQTEHFLSDVLDQSLDVLKLQNPMMRSS